MHPSEPSRTLFGLSLRQAALLAGLAYLFNPVTFAEFYAMPHLFTEDPAHTVANLAAHPRLFAAAILCYLVSAIGDIVLAWSLFVLLAPVHRALAALASLFQLVYAAAWIAAIADLGVLFRIVHTPLYAAPLQPSAVAEQSVLLLAAFHSGWGLALILFGLHLVLTGWLIARSTYIPRVLGWALALAGAAYVVDSAALYLFPALALAWLTPIFALELLFMIWLLGWGWRLREPTEAAQHP